VPDPTCTAGTQGQWDESHWLGNCQVLEVLCEEGENASEEGS